MRKIIQNFAALAIGLLILAACSSEEVEQETVTLEGPLIEADSMRILYSDSAIVRVMVEAPKQYAFENDDLEFPQGIYLEFYEPDGSVSSTLEADHGFRFQEENRYTGVGNVKLVGVKEGNKLFTDTLHWSPAEERIYTQANVMIVEGEDTLRGKGLEAAQGFSTYTILQPEGSRVFVEQDSVESE